MLPEPIVLSGPNHFAYTKQRGARDALAFLVMTWIQGFNARQKIGVYCSDVSGAFDKVSAHRLTQKLIAKGVPENVRKVFVSWLRKRNAMIAVGESCRTTCFSKTWFSKAPCGVQFSGTFSSRTPDLPST